MDCNCIFRVSAATQLRWDDFLWVLVTYAHFELPWVALIKVANCDPVTLGWVKTKNLPYWTSSGTSGDARIKDQGSGSRIMMKRMMFIRRVVGWWALLFPRSRRTPNSSTVAPLPPPTYHHNFKYCSKRSLHCNYSFLTFGFCYVLLYFQKLQ